MSLLPVLLALTLRGAAAFLLVEGADRLAARFAPGQGHLGRRLAWLAAALIFLVPLHPARFAVPGAGAVFAAWAAGALAVLAVAAVQTVAAQRRWARVRLSTDSRLLTLLEDAKAESGVTAPIGLVVSPEVPAPALLGWLRPRILLPSAWPPRFRRSGSAPSSSTSWPTSAPSTCPRTSSSRWSGPPIGSIRWPTSPPVPGPASARRRPTPRPCAGWTARRAASLTAKFCWKPCGTRPPPCPTARWAWASRCAT